MALWSTSSQEGKGQGQGVKNVASDEEVLKFSWPIIQVLSSSTFIREQDWTLFNSKKTKLSSYLVISNCSSCNRSRCLFAYFIICKLQESSNFLQTIQ